MNKLPLLTVAVLAALLSPSALSATDADIVCADDLPMAEGARIKKEAKKKRDKEKKEADKNAAAWFKAEMERHTKGAELLKNITGNKALDKNLKKLRSLYISDFGTLDRDEISPHVRPRGAAYLEQELQHSEELLKAKSRLKKQINRVRGLKLQNEQLDETLDYMEERLLYNYADGQLNIDMTGGDEVNE